jgi:hypothetical protein
LRRVAHLGELIEDLRQVLRRNADASVGHMDYHAPSRHQGTAHRYAAALGEFDGVGHEVAENDRRSDESQARQHEG